MCPVFVRFFVMNSFFICSIFVLFIVDSLFLVFLFYCGFCENVTILNKKETQQLYFTKFLANYDTIRNHCIFYFCIRYQAYESKKPIFILMRIYGVIRCRPWAC